MSKGGTVCEADSARKARGVHCRQSRHCARSAQCPLSVKPTLCAKRAVYLGDKRSAKPIVCVMRIVYTVGEADHVREWRMGIKGETVCEVEGAREARCVDCRRSRHCARSAQCALLAKPTLCAKRTVCLGVKRSANPTACAMRIV